MTKEELETKQNSGKVLWYFPVYEKEI